MNQQEIYDKIIEWEENAGESFIDYFMHSNVSYKDWANFLLIEGFIERADAILESLASHEEKGQLFICLDQDFLYNVISMPNITRYEGYKNIIQYECEDTEEDQATSHLKYFEDVKLWAEFLALYEDYKIKFLEFLEEN